MSSRRNASVVVALGVAALAATSLAAMVATSELLVESFAQPVAEPLDPPVPDLGVPGVIQVEPRAGVARSLPPLPPLTRAQAEAAAPRRAEPATVRAPVADPPNDPGAEAHARPSLPRPVRPEDPRPSEPEPPRPQRPRRRWADHRPDKRVRIPAHGPHRPRPAGPDGDHGGGSPCPDRPRHDEDRRRRDAADGRSDKRERGADRDGRQRNAAHPGR